jgi:hypothetical protein
MKSSKFVFVLSFLAFASVAQESSPLVVEQPKGELSEQEQRTLDNTVRSLDVNYLNTLYKSNGSYGKQNFSYDYLLDRPLNMVEIREFNHPYLNKTLDEITVADKMQIIESIKSERAKDMRQNSVRNVAMRYATQSALYHRGQEFLTILKEFEPLLMQDFNFEALMLAKGKIQPAVIDKVDFSRMVEDERTQRQIKTSYVLVQQSRIVEDEPKYIDFFNNLNFTVPNAPNKFLIPVSDEEKMAWRRGVEIGWVEGIKQADRIIQHDIRKLVRYFIGSVRFHILMRMNVLTAPTLKESTIGTTSNGTVLNVGESVFEITNLPSFNDKEMTWIALPELDDIFAELERSTVDELMSELNSEFSQ